MKHPILVMLLLSFTKLTTGSQFSYKGCYKSSSVKSDLTFNNEYTWQSTSYCQNKCSGSTYAALTEGNDCYCGDDNISASADDDSNCDTDCTGYPYETCGGSDYFAVYVNDDLDDDDTSSGGSSSTSSSSSSSSSSAKKTSSSSSSSSSNTSSSSSTATTSSSSSSSSSSVSTTSSSSSTSASSSSVNMVTITQSNSQTIVTETASSSSSSSLSSKNSNNSSNSLSKGAIAGIVVGVVLGLLIVAALILFFLYRRHKENKDQDHSNNSDQMIQDFVQSNAMNLKHKSSNSTLTGDSGNNFDDEKMINNDGFVFMSNEERLAMERGKRRLSDGSLPDARQNNSGTGLRVINPDL